MRHRGAGEYGTNYGSLGCLVIIVGHMGWRRAWVLIVVFAVIAPGASAAPTISRVTYSPRPLRGNVLSVTFTANRSAHPGYEYGVTFYSLNESAPRPCAWSGLSWIKGEGGDPRRHIRTRGRHTLTIQGKYFGAPQAFCVGRAAIEVVEHRVGSAAARNLGRGSSLRLVVP